MQSISPVLFGVMLVFSSGSREPLKQEQALIVAQLKNAQTVAANRQILEEEGRASLHFMPQ